jgi:hypothetical protein
MPPFAGIIRIRSTGLSSLNDGIKLSALRHYDAGWLPDASKLERFAPTVKRDNPSLK